MNESESENVPPADSNSPSESSPPPTVAPASTEPLASLDSSAPVSTPSGETAGGAPAAEPQPSGDAPSGDAAAGAAGDGAASGAEEGDGQKRRRRRRRKRKSGATGSEEADGATGATSDGVKADAGAAPRVSNPQKTKRKSRDRGDRGRGDRGRGDQRQRGKDSQHSATIAVRALADMAHSLLRVEGLDPLSVPRYLDLQLRVPLDGGNDIRHAAGTAVEQILQRVREVREHERALRSGAVYSYFADSSYAEGCRPSEPRHVFDGYSSTGKPNFSDFVTLAIERKDANIERMLAGEEIILTHVSMGRVLRTQQLAEFGGNSPVYKILGQVDAGLFRVLGDAGRGAFSFQLLRGSTLEGRVRLRLHPVGAVDPMDLADPALMQILSRFQRKLDTEALRLEGRLKGGEVDEEEFVLPLLQDFAKQLQSRTRNQGRRTQHGMQRSDEGQRPTPKAYPDASDASDASILWDVDQSTICVLGPKGRVHVFTPVGKHVTSVVMQRSAVERRRQQGRWRMAEPEERGEFRIQIKHLVAIGQDQVQEDVAVESAEPEATQPSPPIAAPADPGPIDVNPGGQEPPA